MDFGFKIHTNNGLKFIEIIDFKSDIHSVTIPSDIEGIPITDISQRALISSSHINTFRIYAKNNDYSLARYILRETAQDLRIKFLLPDGELALSFPGFFSNSLEDTMARAIHLRIEGCGYAYRECVLRNKIDTYTYDSLFERAVSDNKYCATDIALDRLRYPLMLTEKNRLIYENYIKNNPDTVIPYLIKSSKKNRLSFVLSNFSFERTVYQDALRFCANTAGASLTPIIMQAASKLI